MVNNCWQTDLAKFDDLILTMYSKGGFAKLNGLISGIGWQTDNAKLIGFMQNAHWQASSANILGRPAQAVKHNVANVRSTHRRAVEGC